MNTIIKIIIKISAMNNKYNKTPLELVLESSQFKDKKQLESDVMHVMMQNYTRYGQPIIDVNNNEIHHFELLLRDKETGRFPNRDVDILEERGLSHLLDRASLVFALNTISNGDTEKPLAINISAESLKASGFTDYVENSVRRMKDHHLLKLEFTETVKLEDTEKIAQFMKKMQSYGIKIAADDFGSGYMDENTVHALPFDEVKLDGAIVQNLDDKNIKQDALDMVQYAKERNIEVVAEFIDSDKILNEVKELGVNLGQGYHLGMPKPLSEYYKKPPAPDSSEFTM